VKLRYVTYKFLQLLFNQFGFRLTLTRYKSFVPKLKGSKFDLIYLEKVAFLVKFYTKVQPRNLLEVGANLGQDSAYLSHIWRIENQNVYAIEPIAEYANAISKTYGFTTLPLAASNQAGFSMLKFQSNPSVNLGNASLHSHPTNDVREEQVATERLDVILDRLMVSELDFLKIDVEGHAFHVLEGLGSAITNVRIIQLETDNFPIWNNSVTQEKVFKLLTDNDFILINFEISRDGIQGDSLWVGKSFLKRRIFDSKANLFREV
jgi:FkbM family methyltransferase